MKKNLFSFLVFFSFLFYFGSLFSVDVYYGDEVRIRNYTLGNAWEWGGILASLGHDQDLVGVNTDNLTNNPNYGAYFKIENAGDPSKTGPVRFGDIVRLKGGDKYIKAADGYWAVQLNGANNEDRTKILLNKFDDRASQEIINYKDNILLVFNFKNFEKFFWPMKIEWQFYGYWAKSINIVKHDDQDKNTVTDGKYKFRFDPNTSVYNRIKNIEGYSKIDAIKDATQISMGCDGKFPLIYYIDKSKKLLKLNIDTLESDEIATGIKQVSVGQDGTVFAVNTQNKIIKILPEGQIIKIIGAYLNPIVAVGDKNNIFICDRGSAYKAIDPENAQSSTVDQDALDIKWQKLDEYKSVAYISAGNGGIHIVILNNDEVYRNLSGQLEKIPGKAKKSYLPSSEYAYVINGEGNLYKAVDILSEINKIDWDLISIDLKLDQNSDFAINALGQSIYSRKGEAFANFDLNKLSIAYKQIISQKAKTEIPILEKQLQAAKDAKDTAKIIALTTRLLNAKANELKIRQATLKKLIAEATKKNDAVRLAELQPEYDQIIVDIKKAELEKLKNDLNSADSRGLTDDVIDIQIKIDTLTSELRTSEESGILKILSNISNFTDSDKIFKLQDLLTKVGTSDKVRDAYIKAIEDIVSKRDDSLNSALSQLINKARFDTKLINNDSKRRIKLNKLFSDLQAPQSFTQQLIALSDKLKVADTNQVYQNWFLDNKSQIMTTTRAYIKDRIFMADDAIEALKTFINTALASSIFIIEKSELSTMLASISKDLSPSDLLKNLVAAMKSKKAIANEDNKNIVLVKARIIADALTVAKNQNATLPVDQDAFIDLMRNIYYSNSFSSDQQALAQSILKSLGTDAAETALSDLRSLKQTDPISQRISFYYKYINNSYLSKYKQFLVGDLNALAQDVLAKGSDTDKANFSKLINYLKLLTRTFSPTEISILNNIYQSIINPGIALQFVATQTPGAQPVLAAVSSQVLTDVNANLPKAATRSKPRVGR